MILLDYREGSGDLEPYLRAIAAPVTVTTIPADACWAANGPDDRPITFGVEIKQFEDVMKCMTDGRFAAVDGQVAELMLHYDYIYLLIEASIRPDPATGNLQYYKWGQWVGYSIGGRQLMWRDFQHWLTSLEVQAGLRWDRTFNREETALWLKTKYTWGQKNWDDHGTMKVFNRSHRNTAAMVKPTLRRLIASDLPGIGWDRSAAVAARFSNVREMINANEQTWSEIVYPIKYQGENRLVKIGKSIASRIVKAITGSD